MLGAVFVFAITSQRNSYVASVGRVRVGQPKLELGGCALAVASALCLTMFLKHFGLIFSGPCLNLFLLIGLVRLAALQSGNYAGHNEC